jgi:hypothetical protein
MKGKQNHKKKVLQSSLHGTYSTCDPASGNSAELFLKSQQLLSYLRNCLPMGSTLTQQANLLYFEDMLHNIHLFPIMEITFKNLKKQMPLMDWAYN